jgi:hypothetical protein
LGFNELLLKMTCVEAVVVVARDRAIPLETASQSKTKEKEEPFAYCADAAVTTGCAVAVHDDDVS